MSFSLGPMDQTSAYLTTMFYILLKNKHIFNSFSK